MPYCVNCGSEVRVGQERCGNCGRNPWELDLSGVRDKEEIEEKIGGWSEKSTVDEGKTVAFLVSFFVLFGAIFLLFGLTIWQLGVFKLGTSGGAYDEGRGMEAKAALGPTYHVYHAFNFGNYAVLVGIAGLAMLIYVWYWIQKEVGSIKALSLAISGMVFIICALFIFIFGFNDLLTYTSGNVHIKPTFTQQYGWLIETFVFGIMGYILIHLGEKVKWGEKIDKPMMSFILKPIAYLLLFIVIYFYLVGVVQISDANYTDYRENLAYLVQALIYTFPCVYLMKHLDKSGGELNVFNAARITVYLLILPLTFIYVMGVHQFLDGEGDYFWILKVAMYLIPAAVLTSICGRIGKEKLRRKYKFFEDVALSIPALILVGASLMLYVGEVHNTFFVSMYHGYDLDFSWFTELLFFVIPAIALLLKSNQINRVEFGYPLLPYVMIGVGLMLLLPSLTVYLVGSSDMLNPGKYELYQRMGVVFSWIIEFIFYGIPSISLIFGGSRLYRADKGETQVLNAVIMLVCMVFILASLWVYVANVGRMGEDYFSGMEENWFIKLLFYVVPAILLLGANLFFGGNREKYHIYNSYLVLSAGLILLFSALAAYVVGVLSLEAEGGVEWIVRFLMYLVPASALLYCVNRVWVKVKGYSLASKLLVPLGQLFMFLFLVPYILGVHGVLKGANDFLVEFSKIMLFGVPAVALIVSGNKLREGEGGRKAGLRKSTLFMGVVLALAAIFFFVFGLHTFLYSPRQEVGDLLRFLLETGMYAVAAIVFIWISEKFDKIKENG